LKSFHDSAIDNFILSSAGTNIRFKGIMMTDQIDQVDDDQGVEKLALLLPLLCERLKAGLHRIEPGFETLGNKLQTVYNDSEKLTKGIRASVDHIHVDSEASLFRDVGKIASCAGGFSKT